MTINLTPVVIVLVVMVSMVAAMLYIIYKATDDDYWY